MPLKGRVAIITGGAQGIGRACAHKFARAGAKLIICDIDEEGGRDVAQELERSGFSCEFVSCDVADRLDILNLMATVIDKYNQVDILLNCAAQRDSTFFLDLTDEEFEGVINVNLKGAFYLARAVGKQMKKQVEEGGEPGAMVMVSSLHSIVADPHSVAYSAASGAISQMTKAMALALAPNGIRVNGIAPSNVMTPMLSKVAKTEALRKKALQRAPFGRFGSPPEIASIALFLASNEASYITGQTIIADGGALPMRHSLDPVDISEDE